jgi:hypothetical protein
MDQATLIRELYRACLEHDRARQLDLLRIEFAEVFKHRSQGRAFDGTWTIVHG